MKVLVTGATGFIGKSLVLRLLEMGFNIRVLARKTSDILWLSHLKNLDLFYGDITDPNSLVGIEDDVDYVFHLAVLGHLHNVSDNHMYFDVNVHGTANLLKRFDGKGLKKFIFTSSTAALGVIPGKTISEKDFVPPVTVYGLSKYRAEKEIKELSDKYGIPYIIIKLTHVYGPGEMRDLYRIIKMIKKGIFPQVGFSANLYPAVFIDDAIQGIILAMKSGLPGETYFISDNDSHDLREIRRIVKKNLAIKSHFYPVFPKFFLLILFIILDKFGRLSGIKLPVNTKNIRFITSGRRFSIDKARKELGYEPLISLEKGLEKTIKFYLEEGLL